MHPEILTAAQLAVLDGLKPVLAGRDFYLAGGTALALRHGHRRSVDLDWFTTREREQSEVLPWDHLDSGLDKDWLWQDWQDAMSGYEQDDCRWTPCFDCGVCPSMDTEIQIGPTGRKLLPITPVNTGLRVPA